MMIRLLMAALLCTPAVAAAQDCAPDALRVELEQRDATDQDSRRRLLADPGSQQALEETLRIDRENTAYMRSVVTQCGWPKRSDIGEAAARSAWRLTQHADMDPDYQVMAARELKWAVLAGEADGRDLAVLVDRNRMLTHHPQVYGMQFRRAPGGAIRFHDIVSPHQLDDRRKEIGLGSFYCWALQVSAWNGNAPLEWPAGILLEPEACPESP